MKTAQSRARTDSRRHATLYDLLGVPPDASLDAIKKAYRRKARELHPDANPDDPDSAHRFDEVTGAYETLADPIRRAHYDRWAGVATTDRRRSRRSKGNIFAADGDDDPDPAAEAEPDAAGAPEPDPRVAPDGGGPAPSAGSGADGGPRTLWSEPPDLPSGIANRITAAIVLLPVVWALNGFPTPSNHRFGEIASWRGALSLVLGAMGWTFTTWLLWARSPSVPRTLPRWRSPGWDGTPLLVRVATFMTLGAVATALLLPELDAADGVQAWRTSGWLLAVALCWVISGQIPRQLGYRSRHDRYWGKPVNTLRPRR